MSLQLPSAPRNYDPRDQREVRRKLMEWAREMERRIQALEAAAAA